MPRELKFRAWDKGRKCMLDVDELMWDRGAVVSLRMGRSDYLFQIESSADAVDLMQFTGLHDSQGHEIYEGDVVRIRDVWDDWVKVIGIVEYADGSFYVRGPLGGYYRWMDYEVEVLGNVHEHPHLLEESPCK